MREPRGLPVDFYAATEEQQRDRRGDVREHDAAGRDDGRGLERGVLRERDGHEREHEGRRQRGRPGGGARAARAERAAVVLQRVSAARVQGRQG